MILETIQSNQNKLENFCKSEGIVFMGVFGSVARKQENIDSDIDLYVKYKNKSDKSLLDIVRMENSLSKLFDKKVDLIHNPKPLVLNNINKDIIRLYETV